MTNNDFLRVNNDINGNPRYVCHFLELVNDNDRDTAEELSKAVRPFKFPVSHLYDIACQKANVIGGKRYRAKHYGGGIVFQSYNISDDVKRINKIKLTDF